MKINPPKWSAPDFECMNVLINVNDKDNDIKIHDNNNDNANVNDNDGVTDKLFIHKPVAIGYFIVKNPNYDNLNLEKDDYSKYFGEDCVEWFINEILEIETQMKNYFKNEIEINFDTIPENYNTNNCSLCEKRTEVTKRCSKCIKKDLPICKENSIFKDHCHLTGKNRESDHSNWNLNTRKAFTSIVPILFHQF